jgi:hypothetical protein
LENLVILAEALARIKELEDEVQRLRYPGVAYVPCQSHRFHNFAMQVQVSCAPPLKSVCPICAGMATNISGPSFMA